MNNETQDKNTIEPFLDKNKTLYQSLEIFSKALEKVISEINNGINRSEFAKLSKKLEAFDIAIDSKINSPEFIKFNEKLKTAIQKHRKEHIYSNTLFSNNKLDYESLLAKASTPLSPIVKSMNSEESGHLYILNSSSESSSFVWILNCVNNDIVKDATRILFYESDKPLDLIHLQRVEQLIANLSNLGIKGFVKNEGDENWIPF